MRIPTIRQRAQMTTSGAQGHTTIPEDSWAHLRVRYHLLHPYGAGCLDSQGHLVQPGSASTCFIGWWAHGWEGIGTGLGQGHRSIRAPLTLSTEVGVDYGSYHFTIVRKGGVCSDSEWGSWNTPVVKPLSVIGCVNLDKWRKLFRLHFIDKDN